MVSKFFELYSILKRVDKEDIAAIKEFIVVLRSQGKSISKSIRSIIDAGNEALEEIQD